MTRRFRLTVLGAIAALALAVPVSTQRGTPPSRTQAGPRKKLLFLTHAGLYRHPSLGPAEKAVAEIGKAGGEGRVFYTALGHRDDIWSNNPVFRAHIGIRWAPGLE